MKNLILILFFSSFLSFAWSQSGVEVTTNSKVSENLSENKRSMQKEKFLQTGSQHESTFPILNSVKI